MNHPAQKQVDAFGRDNVDLDQGKFCSTLTGWLFAVRTVPPGVRHEPSEYDSYRHQLQILCRRPSKVGGL